MTPDDRKQIIEELRVGLGSLPAKELGPWAVRTAEALRLAATRRLFGLAVLPAKIVSGVYGVALEAAQSAYNKEFLRYVKQSALTVGDKAGEVAKGANALRQIVASDPKQGAVHVAVAVLGFYAGSGGLDGDGGIPDLDLALAGLGAHRSILTHSMFAGVLVECATLSFLDLIDIVYFYLPEDHHSFWDKSVIKADAALSLASVSISAGLAFHFLIDSALDSGKAYTDLPISLPLEIHQSIMLVNAIGEGVAASSAVMGALEKQQVLDMSIVRLEGIMASDKLDARKKRNRLESMLRLLRDLYRSDSSLFDEHRVARLKLVADASRRCLGEVKCAGSLAAASVEKVFSLGAFKIRYEQQ
ncbi:hypothetical protein N1030_07155 [Desulfovibrio mangrovi]|uniref:hypothetical protein n=1 Tax=Desulfovibrio mangrovi TaxID=2976983 RepID=UPI0022451CE6|nr:hypothetical protein [Desulfovibrio mangrovi]UZP68741.1 hypothetical protein N1030_07155 [Desulfovibrio mangrovi]